MDLVWIFLLALAFMPTCFGLSFFIVYQIWLIRRPEIIRIREGKQYSPDSDRGQLEYRMFWFVS